jgi:hypothetical protein
MPDQRDAGPLALDFPKPDGMTEISSFLERNVDDQVVLTVQA